MFVDEVGMSPKEEMDTVTELKEKKISQAKITRTDSLSLEAQNVSIPGSTEMGWAVTLSLAFQSLGIVYGDLGTSPLYVFSSTFPNGIKDKDDVLGILSIIYYTIFLIPFLKYVLIVLWANDNGNGGAFALYSLICRHLKMSLIPNQQPEDMELSNYKLETPSSKVKRAKKIKKKLERSHFARILLLGLTLLGTSMVIGDGILTPTISVMSAVSGVGKSLGQDAVVGISIAILFILFFVQKFGTDKVGFVFAPILCLWFLFNAGIGIYNTFKYEIGVLRAFNPKYIVDYFQRNGKDAFLSLGGAFLCTTGSEAMFADLGHFNVRAIQISFTCVTFPSILIAYTGQAAYLRQFPENVANTFYACIPGPLYWPTFVVAVAGAIIASQAMISGAFSIISQALSLGCFPTIKIVHTSIKHRGQVFIPEVNYMFMIACIVICAAFRTSEQISNAYGIAVVGDMLITTTLVTLIMLVIWKRSIWQVAIFFLVFFCLEGTYFAAQIIKFVRGGYLPIVLALFMTALMGLWHYVYKEKYIFELKNKVSNDYLKELAANPNVTRVPGIGLLYSELVQSIPPIFKHFIDSVPSIHSVVVFVSIKAIPVNSVVMEERFLFRQVDPKEYRMFRCVVRHGYNDVLEDPAEFETQLVQHLMKFIKQESFFLEAVEATKTNESEMVDNNRSSNSCSLSSTPILGAEEEVKFIEKQMQKNVVHMLTEADVVAEPNSSFLNKIVVNYAYNFLKKNFRDGEKLMAIPRKRLLKVGMTYEI